MNSLPCITLDMKSTVKKCTISTRATPTEELQRDQDLLCELYFDGSFGPPDRHLF
jgi:hypothetical protein